MLTLILDFLQSIFWKWHFKQLMIISFGHGSVSMARSASFFFMQYMKYFSDEILLYDRKIETQLKKSQFIHLRPHPIEITENDFLL